MRLERPRYVTSQIAFYDDSRLSEQPDIDGFVSIELHGYVHTNNGTRITAMHQWIEEAEWTAIQAAWQATKISKTICRGSKTQTILGPSSLHSEALG